MYRFGLIAGVAVLAAAGLPQLASAQPQPPVTMQRPTFSPYLNMLRPGGSPALNYFGLVQPQQQFMRQNYQMQQGIQQNNANIQALAAQTGSFADPSMPLTGHGAVFNNTGHYFNSNPVYGGRGGAGGFGRGVGGGFASGMGGGFGNTGSSFGGMNRPGSSRSGSSSGGSSVGPRR